MAVIGLDLDGTLARKHWPGIGDPFPHMVEGLSSLREDGHELLLFTYRTSPYYFGSLKERPPTEVLEQEERTFEWLDRYGLDFVKLWTKPGKPNYHLLVDDRAIWFPGRENSWKVMPDRIRARLGK